MFCLTIDPNERSLVCATLDFEPKEFLNLKNRENFYTEISELLFQRGDLRICLYGLSDFRNLIFLDHRNFVFIPLKLHFYCIFKYNFQFFPKNPKNFEKRMVPLLASNPPIANPERYPKPL